MVINEAAKIASKENKLMVRQKFYEDFGEGAGAIDPSNGYDCCRILKKTDGVWKQRERCWNPTLDDLTADDWEVIPKE